LNFKSLYHRKANYSAFLLPEYGGRVFFAGEHISGVHRWMQGALQTGMQAALDLAVAARRRE
jgi:monoamine oxidase